MPLDHSAMPPDDLADSRKVRFRMRGEDALVDCYVGWDALDALEGAPAISRADRLQRFETHRVRIEAAIVRKHEAGAKGDITLDASDVLGSTELRSTPDA